MEQFPMNPKWIFKGVIESAIAYGFLLPIVFSPIFFGVWMSQEVLLIAGAIMLLFFVYFFILRITYYYRCRYFATYFYDLMPDHVVVRSGVITPREITIPYERIQDVCVSQDFDDRIFGLHNVYISSATGSAGKIEGLEKEVAEGLRAIFLDKIRQRIGKESVGFIHNR